MALVESTLQLIAVAVVLAVVGVALPAAIFFAWHKEEK